MNGKFILLMMVGLNLITFAVSLGCATSTDLNCKIGDNDIIKMFVDEDKIKLDASSNENTGFALNSEFEEEASSFQQAQSGVNPDNEGALTAFLDGLKIIFGMASLLTPFPILGFFFSLGMPMWLSMIIALPLFLLYVIALMEFFKGGPL